MTSNTDISGDVENMSREIIRLKSMLEQFSNTNGILSIFFEAVKGSDDSYKMFLEIAQQHDKAKDKINLLNGKIELLEEHVNRLETQIQVL